MAYWDYFWHYPRSVPKPVKDGIKTKSRGGSIGKTWWSKRWIGVLESFNMGARAWAWPQLRAARAGDLD